MHHNTASTAKYRRLNGATTQHPYTNLIVTPSVTSPSILLISSLSRRLVRGFRSVGDVLAFRLRIDGRARGSVFALRQGVMTRAAHCRRFASSATESTTRASCALGNIATCGCCSCAGLAVAVGSNRRSPRRLSRLARCADRLIVTRRCIVV
ncbi:hypothetical protein F4804DRAFT_296137 [Jackrogersella minutella]|nr:hypothetical protein F4804DRAFT_296137 [Jackrogersella minutella]